MRNRLEASRKAINDTPKWEKGDTPQSVAIEICDLLCRAGELLAQITKEAIAIKELEDEIQRRKQNLARLEEEQFQVRAWAEKVKKMFVDHEKQTK